MYVRHQIASGIPAQPNNKFFTQTMYQTETIDKDDFEHKGEKNNPFTNR